MVRRRLTELFGWTRHSTYLLSAFLLTVFLIAYVWWPLAEDALAYFSGGQPWWVDLLYFDWLLVGIFLGMSFLIMAHADLRVDARIVLVGAVGGLVIESWGTQTNLWTYYTNERPPLWIIPAWPIASLAIDRLERALQYLLRQIPQEKQAQLYRGLYWLVFGSFYALMLMFVTPTLDKSFTWMALLLCALLILTPTDHRMAVLTFAAGSGLGYFLELWGTTRQCWTYYTLQTPPLFAVLAHGMAAVAFWRAGLVAESLLKRLSAARLFASRQVQGQG
jgi:hypothetical protein